MLRPLLLVLAFGLFACGGSASPVPTPGATPAPTPTNDLGLPPLPLGVEGSHDPSNLVPPDDALRFDAGVLSWHGPEIDDLVSDYFRGGPDFKSGVNAALTLIAGYTLTTLAERAKARPAVCADCLAEIEGDVTQRTATGDARCADSAAS